MRAPTVARWQPGGDGDGSWGERMEARQRSLTVGARAGPGPLRRIGAAGKAGGVRKVVVVEDCEGERRRPPPASV